MTETAKPSEALRALSNEELITLFRDELERRQLQGIFSISDPETSMAFNRQYGDEDHLAALLHQIVVDLSGSPVILATTISAVEQVSKEMLQSITTDDAQMH